MLRRLKAQKQFQDFLFRLPNVAVDLELLHYNLDLLHNLAVIVLPKIYQVTQKIIDYGQGVTIFNLD